MGTLIQDLRYAFRSLRRSPGFTAVAIVTLALGIGATTAIYSVVRGVLLRPLPFPDADRLVMVWRTLPTLGFDRAPVSYPNLAAWRAGSPAFEELGGFAVRLATMVEAGNPERVRGAYATASLFRTLGAEPVLGRAFAAEEDRPGGDRVILLAHALWMDRFAGDPTVLGRAVRLDGESYTVVGVMPPGFRFPSEETAFWTPAPTMPESDDRGTNFLRAVGRVAAGADPVTAEAQVQAVIDRLRQTYPDLFLEGEGARVESLHEYRVGHTRPVLTAFLGGVVLLLVLACSNLANLMLARTTTRRGELAVRSALGAGRGRLVRQLCAEVTILAAVGGVAAVLLGHLLLDALVAMAPAGIPRLSEARIGPGVVAFTAGIAALAALLIGLLPALRLSHVDGLPALPRSAGATDSRAGLGPRRLLVVAQAALALVLLAGAGLLARSLDRLLAVDPGFRSEGVLAFQIALPADRYPEPAAVDAFFSELLRRVAALPEVEAAGSAMSVPLRPEYASTVVEIEGRPPRPGQENLVGVIPMRGDYFSALGIDLVAGRAFGAADAPEAPDVAIINRAMAERYWPGADPLGRRFGEPEGWTTVVGVVENVRREGIDRPAPPEAYVPHAQSEWLRSQYVVLRAREGDPARFITPVRELVRRMDPLLPVTNVNLLSRLVSSDLSAPRFRTAVLSAFAALGVLLAAVGLYGLVSFHVARRAREIAIRMALGATRGRVLRGVLRESAVLLAAGAAVGLPAAALGSRALESLLYEVSPLDPLTFLGAAVLLGAVAMAGACIPAGWATAVNPARVLRHE